MPELAKRVLRFASATGCVWELHDIYDPAWAGEKRRLWDSAVVLMGMTHALLRRSPGTTGFSLPSPPFDAEALLRKADEALYEAKAGRDRTVICRSAEAGEAALVGG